MSGDEAQEGFRGLAGRGQGLGSRYLQLFKVNPVPGQVS